MSFNRDPPAPIAKQNSTNSFPRPNATRLQRAVRGIPEPYVIPLCGAISGAVSGVVTCPLDVIKTKLQAQGGFQPVGDGTRASTAAYRGVIGTSATILREDGVRGMYRGLGPMLMGYVPTWAVYLTVYNKAQAYFRTKIESYFWANVYASLTAGGSSTLVTNPIWVIKTRLMSQTNPRVRDHSRSPWQYKNTWDAARVMYQKEGVLSFYSGLAPALLGLTHVAIQFPLYEILKERFTGIGKGVSASEADSTNHYWSLAAAVFLSKACASTATYPHEVVRTRLQTQQRSYQAVDSTPSTIQQGMGKSGDHGRPPGSPTATVPHLKYRGLWQACKVIYIEEGWRGFYAGLGTNLIRAIPSAMTTILTFEYLKKTLFQIRREGIDDVEGQSA